MGRCLQSALRFTATINNGISVCKLHFKESILFQRFQKHVIFHIMEFASSSIFSSSHSTDVVKTALKQKRAAACLEGINSQTCDGKCFRGERVRLADIKVVGWWNCRDRSVRRLDQQARKNILKVPFLGDLRSLQRSLTAQGARQMAQKTRSTASAGTSTSLETFV